MLHQSSSAHAVNACLQKVSKQMKARLVVDTARGSLSAAALGSSFILTGNLLAPYLASVSCDLLFSYYQRSKFQELKQRMEQRVTKMMGGLQEMAAASTKVSPHGTNANSEMVSVLDRHGLVQFLQMPGPIMRCVSDTVMHPDYKTVS